jgi:putative transcriptional regulator
MHQALKEKIAGEITLSSEAGSTIRKWRTLFGMSQKELALTHAVIEIELARGGENLKRFEDEEDTSAILSIGEFSSACTVERFIGITDSECLNTEQVNLERQIYGYTIIDSIKAITSFSSNDYMKVYGWSTERALLFSGVHYGRSPMIAVRAHPMKPAIVVYIQPENVDDLAVRLAELEHIVLLRTELPPQELARRLEAHR